ncbi:MAG: cupin domain-containing protein [Armatimonadetes bacterium]|nr:cupin domain-containing protein [Armatimonadota bacterium]
MAERTLDETTEREEFRKQHLYEGMAFKNLKAHPVRQRKMRGSASAHFALSGNRTIDAHISELPPGGHNKRHRHVNEAIIYILVGRGYSIIQKEGEPPTRIDWEEGDMFSPPLWAWHQHFNTDSQRPARYLAVTNAPLMITMGLFRKEQAVEET